MFLDIQEVQDVKSGGWNLIFTCGLSGGLVYSSYPLIMAGAGA